MTIEDNLRDALHAHADSVEPTAGGLERIEARLASAPSRPRLAPRLLVAAGLLLVVGGLAVLTFGDRGGDDVAALTSSSTTDPSGAAPIDDELLPLPDDENPSTETGNGATTLSDANPQVLLPPAPAGVLGPRATTTEAAIVAFFGLIQRSDEDFAYELDGDAARITRVAENGQSVEVTVLQLGSVEMDDGSLGVVVVRAHSPSAIIESPALLSTISGETLEVSGQGEGFEAIVGVELYSSDDGVWLGRQSARAGNFGVVAPFEASLPISGAGPAWIVVQSSTGANTNLAPFSAVPVKLDAPQAGPDYLVTNIPVGDPDGGLVVRTLPGTEGNAVGVLPSGQGGIRKRAALSAFVGDGESIIGEPASYSGEEWWSVWVPEPLENGRQWGWVNSRYLTTGTSVAAGEMEALGLAFADGLRGDGTALASLPWSPQGATIGIQSDVRALPAAALMQAEYWTEVNSWILPEDYGGTVEAAPRELLSPTQELLTPEAAVNVEVLKISDASPYPGVNEQFASLFAGSTVVRLTDPTNDGSGWRIVNLFAQQGASGPEIVGVVAVMWVP